MRSSFLLLAPLLMAQTEQSPLVPEGIHSSATKPDLCGFTAATLDELQNNILSDESFQEGNSTDRYLVYYRDKDFIQFAFPRAGYLSFPMATCIAVVPTSGGSAMNRELYCEGTRDECDRIFIEWNEHDKQVRESLGMEHS